ncbi:MAG: hypothetical protein ACE5JM_00385 [Armatimonadota bacterium]
MLASLAFAAMATQGWAGTDAGGQLPPQVTGLEVLHRAGQTFITWKEIEDVVGRDEVNWRELKSLLEGIDSERRVRYVVYRSSEPITSENLHEAEEIARVKPLSCWNVNGRNVERPIDDFIATEPLLEHGQGNPFGNATPDGEYGLDCPIDRLVIQDGAAPLPRGSGLYVHTPGRAGEAHYAVVTSIDGVQNTVALSPANATVRPVAETDGAGEPVLQRVLPPGPLWSYAEERLHYVRWVAPPYGNLPSQYYNWSVGIPEELGTSVPLELNLHRDNGSYWRTQYRLERDSIVLSPHDFPLRTWWYGYNENQGTLKSLKAGRIHNYTERRLLAFIDWAVKRWPIDRNRIVVTGVRWSGGSGALRLGIRHPEVFSLVVAGHAVPEMTYLLTDLNDTRRDKGRFNVLEDMWGKIEWGLKTASGENVWEALDLNRHVAALPPAAELPMVAMTSDASWKPCHRFYSLMLEKRHAILANFTWGGQKMAPVSANSTWPDAIRQDVRRNRLMVAFKGATADDTLATGRQGEFNWPYRWRPETVVDEPGRCEVTVYHQGKYGGREPPKADVSLRWLQSFKVQPGMAYRWTVTPLPAKDDGSVGGPRRGEPPTETSGQVTVGEDGVLTIPGVDIGRAGSHLVITPA